jgi:hypothetical protein
LPGKFRPARNSRFLPDGKGESIVGELHDWLSRQHPGLKTFKAFRQQMIDRADTDTHHRALYRLLASLAGDYISRYDAEPVPVDVAEQSFRHLLALVADAEASLTAPAAQQIQALNALAAAKLV